MKKIDTMFVRDAARPKFVTREVQPGCEWVLAGEGVPTRKYDGTCCLIRGGVLYKRCEWDAGKGEAPASWLHHSFDPAQRSGHGWIPVVDGTSDRWHIEAFNRPDAPREDGTYELCGPKVQGNPEKYEQHVLVRHGSLVLDAVPRDFDGLRAYLLDHTFEGIVFHHPDGRMAKIKRRDFESM